MQYWFKEIKSVCLAYHIYKLKEKTISKDAEKALNKIN